MSTPEPHQTVLLVDDHPLFRRGLSQLIQTIASFALIGEASGGAEGIELQQRLQPDLMLLDLNMRDISGLEVLRAIKATDTDTRILIITVSDHGEDLVAALRAGADGYLLKDMEPEQMVDRLKAAANGQVVVSDSLTHLLASALRGEPRPESPEDAGLTEQELRIIERLASGLSNKLIARDLDIAEGTVKVHVKHILRKLNLRSRVEAAVWAVGHLKR
ncbi:two-component system response regulator NarL [Cognatazoarcus halotolerans]|uniref:two-component system response regulator NarL n=1 Tax=Cognatazoarcus halotolerans TaxID=2686016 RepID=UPI00135BD54E|nr:two-component system response regulator NarL [Cognatazoarcus halotolerans]MCB1901395.1 two-component system response regulator NarL [Rhodocyclaceae bacterium]MCP5311243.1 two-component system response regulator NarL [Zoogloeaceae bacterium]